MKQIDSKPKLPNSKKYRRFLHAVILLGICTYIFYLFQPPKYSAKELHEMALVYQHDDTRKDILDVFAEVARGNSRFVRNSATRKFGWIGKREELDPKYLKVVYDNLFHHDTGTVAASAETLAFMERSELPVDVQLRLVEIIRGLPGSSRSLNAIRAFSALELESIQCTDELLPLLADVSELGYMDAELATELHKTLKEEGL